jgi:putative DNA primase/helicase
VLRDSMSTATDKVDLTGAIGLEAELEAEDERDAIASVERDQEAHMPPGDPTPPVEAYEGEPKGNGQTPVPAMRPRIRLEPGHLHESVRSAERLVSDEVYVRAGRVVRIGLSPEMAAIASAGIVRDERQPVILPVTTHHLRRRLTELAAFEVYRRREKEWMAIDCPNDLTDNIIGVGDWPRFAPLTAIATAPFIRADFSVCDTPGYDRSSGIYYQPTQSFPPVPASPTREQAVEAKTILLAPFNEFPYESAATFSAFAAHLLAQVVRASLDTTPAILYSAPVAATGKSLLASMPALIATGANPAVHPWTDEAAEIRKVLLATLLAGDATLLLDNITAGAKIRSPTLCGFLTADIYSDRRLSTSETPAIPNRVQVTLTGNNITPAGDLARRTLVCRLDLNAETARGREFEIPRLREYVTAHRAELLVAALTLVRAYITAGCPRVAAPMESFEAWSRLCRDPLLWLDMADPLETQVAETDDELGPLREAFALIEAMSPREGFLARDLAQAAERLNDDATKLRAAIEASGCANATDVKLVGYWLRAHRGRVAEGRKLTAHSAHGTLMRWRVPFTTRRKHQWTFLNLTAARTFTSRDLRTGC